MERCNCNQMVKIGDIGEGCTACLKVWVVDTKETFDLLGEFFQEYQFKKLIGKYTWDDILKTIDWGKLNSHLHKHHVSKGFEDENGDCEWCRRRWGEG